MGVFHVKPFKCPQPAGTAIWASSMQTMSLRVGNANVVLPSTVHEALSLSLSFPLPFVVQY
jgi:hypothetical protein